MKANFITAFAEPFDGRLINEAGEVIMTIGKYAAWGPKGHWTGKDEVIKCSDDLNYLLEKYGDLPVYELNKGEAKQIR